MSTPPASSSAIAPHPACALPHVQVSGPLLFFLKGWLSQWHPSPFVVDGQRYTCAEQYMMAEKATLFGDGPTHTAIMATSHPAEQKRLGRQVRNFREETWKAHARNIVYRGNYAKFSQDAKLAEWLLRTGHLVLAEANPRDVVWGIGLVASDPAARERERWRGTNWLGEELMRVREALRVKS